MQDLQTNVTKTPIIISNKLQKNKNYPDNINKGLTKFKLVEEFQGKRRGGTIKYRFVTHY